MHIALNSDTSKRNVQYVERKANISYQAEQIELALAPETPVEISELENAVHRVRKGEFLPSLKTFYGMYNDVFSGAGYKVLPPAPFASEKNVDSNGFSAWLKAKGEGLPAEQREEMQKALNAFYRKFAAAQDTLLNSKKTEADVKNYHRALDEGVRDLNRTANQIRGLPATPKRTRPEFGPVLTDADVKAFTDLELARVISNRHE